MTSTYIWVIALGVTLVGILFIVYILEMRKVAIVRRMEEELERRGPVPERPLYSTSDRPHVETIVGVSQDSMVVISQIEGSSMRNGFYNLASARNLVERINAAIELVEKKASESAAAELAAAQKSVDVVAELVMAVEPEK